MKGYVQMTPVPPELDKDEEVLDRIVKAVDGNTDQSDRRKAFYEQENKAFLEWSGAEEKSWRFSFLRGYPTLFVCFYTPVFPDEVEPKPYIHEKVDSFVSELASDVVHGDTGCKLNDVSFAARARWTITDEKRARHKTSVTSATGQLDSLSSTAERAEQDFPIGQPPAMTGPALGLVIIVVLIGLVLVLLA